MGASRAPADLLEEVFDLNMQLEEMGMARASGEDDPALAKSLSDAKTKFEGLQAEVDYDLRVQWSTWDNGDVATRQAAQKTMVALLDRRRYLSNLVREVNETIGAPGDRSSSLG
jgi:molecular chaperone HscB